MVMVMALYVPWSLFGCEVIINYLTIFLVVELSYALQVGTHMGSPQAWTLAQRTDGQSPNEQL
jgi:hypothetical protein